MSTSPARLAAVEALTRAAEQFPDLGPPRWSLDHLSGADAALALAIYRTAVQRWLTLEHLIDRVARRPMRKTDPAVRAVLLSGAAQLLFLPGVADYAAVDEQVSLVRKVDRPQAAGAVNAVLRRVAKMVRQRTDEPWRPAREALPVERGTLWLTEPLLPRTDNLIQHLAAATSHPLELLTRWHKFHGLERTQALCLHDLQTPPTFVVDQAGAITHWDRPWEQLEAYLAADPRRRVQDPTAAAVVQAVTSVDPRPGAVLDYCAGRGTKTRQIAAAFPEARITAVEVHPQRLDDLRKLAAAFANVSVMEAEQLPSAERFDLILLDVPCSNSGVLARRPEARYRFNRRSLEELCALQRRIIERAAVHMNPAGTMLYATCSIEPAENERQAAWIAERFGAVLTNERMTLPGGSGADYHDGGYYAVLRWPANRSQ